MVGRTVAQYQVLARLGGGGMGVVYTARDTRLGRTVALKFLPPQWSHDEDAKQRFVREAQAASATDHRNICTIHDIAAADDGQLFIVMAYYEGLTLKQRLESGPLPVDEALDIATQIADGLARAHAQGIVHRDVKPGNLILAEDGVRIVDFGLATFADALQLTIAGSTLGTAAYMSPEQVRGEAADAQTDVWATGVILYQMLTGHVPFRGAYAEAIAHAIRHETPASIRAARPEVPEEVEQLVFRALHKETAVRYQSGRELARALRQARGQTVPMDLRTESVVVPSSARVAPSRRGRRLRWMVAAATIALTGGAGWVLLPADRVSIVVVPVANQTGQPDLDAYVPALTYVLVEQLAESARVRPASWPRMLETLRGFRATKSALHSNEVVVALRAAVPGHVLVRPSIVSEGETWRVRIEVLDADRPVTLATFRTDPVAVSVLRKDLAHALMASAALAIEEHFTPRWRAMVSARRPTAARLATLDATRSLVEGLDAYEDQEYPTAVAALTKAAAADPVSPMLQTWLARAAQAMRDDEVARDAVRQARTLLTDETRASDRLLTEGVAAEVSGDLRTAAARFQQLAEVFADDPHWTMERGLFEVRTAQSKEGWNTAIATFHDALARDRGLIRVHVELCRAHNQIQDTQNAITEGRQAVDAARRVGWPGAEAQARFCLVEALRQGQDGERKQAQEEARLALTTLEGLGYSYNVPRAEFYIGVAAWERGLTQEAIDVWSRAEKGIDAGGNEVLRPIVLSNLAAAYEAMGNAPLAFEYVGRSIAKYEALGDERRAARQQRNLATMKVRYGEDAEGGFRDALAVLDVVRARGDVEFEIFTLALIGDYYRIAGRFAESAAELHKALQLAQQQTLRNRVSATTVSLARLAFDEGRYDGALERLSGIVAAETPRAAPEAWIALGRVQARLGDFGGARTTLARVVSEMPREGQPLGPFLELTLGELAFESGARDDARRHFEQAASSWREPFNVESAVEARAYLGLLAALDGRAAAGQSQIQSSLDAARRMGRVTHEMRCRALLAQVALLQRRPEEAVRVLAPIDAAALARAGRELRMQLLHWRGAASTAVGRAGDDDTAAAKALMQELRAMVPSQWRVAFGTRLGLRGIAG